MVANVMELLNNPRRLVMVVGGGLLVLMLVVVTCTMITGDDAAPGPAPEPVGDGLTMEERVQATVEAMTPTEVPTLTPDVPATLVGMVEQTRTARIGEPRPNVSLFAPPDSMATPESPYEMVGAASDGSAYRSIRFTRADERFLQEMGPVLWYSVRLHLEMDDLLSESPNEFITLDGAAKSEQAAYDSDRVGRELRVLEQRWDSLSPRVRDYGRHLEETMQLTRDAAANLQQMFNIARRGVEVEFDTLSDENRRQIEDLYWDTKEILNSFETRIQDYGCSVCGELYRARDLGN